MSREPDEIEDPVVAWSERWVMPYLRDSNLWAVLFALYGSAVVMMAMVQLSAWRSESLVALAGAVALGVASLDLVRRELGARRRPGGLTLIVVAVWGGGAGMAYVAARYGLY